MTNKWEQFSEDNDESSSPESSVEQPIIEAKADLPTGPTKETKNKVVDDLKDVRQTVTDAIASSKGKISQEKLEDLEEAEGTIDGAIGMVSPGQTLANQQEASQSVGMGMGGSSSSGDEDDD